MNNGRILSLLIAILCNLNAREARYLYDYTGSPVCRRMMYRKLKHQKQGECLRGRNFKRLDQLKRMDVYREKKGA